MKFIVVTMLCAVVALSSCIRKQVVLQAENQRDSLAMVVSAKDSLINTVFEDINAITENLAQIKSRENLITVTREAEGAVRVVEQINNDIAAIDRLLAENKAKIASLEYTAAKLRKANVRIAALETTIRDLNTQLGDKTAEIEQLRDKLAVMGVQVETLEREVAERSLEVKNLSDEKTDLENQMNTVYYIVGAEKELRDAQIITKRQGLIGRTLVVNKNCNLELFTKFDSRRYGEVVVGHKNVTIVTTHPEEGYELVVSTGEVVEKLLISNPARFWESSKILIISYK